MAEISGTEESEKVGICFALRATRSFFQAHPIKFTAIQNARERRIEKERRKDDGEISQDQTGYSGD